MADYPFAPWLTNLPDPVAAYSHGLQIGSQIGTEQARQQMAQENLLRETTKDAVDQEIEKGKFHLASDAAARQYADQVKFTQLVQGGMDPAQAMLQVPGIAKQTSEMIRASQEGKMTEYQQAREDRLANRPRFHTAGGAIYKETPEGDLEQAVAAPNAPGTIHAAGGGLYRARPDGSIEELVAPNKLGKLDDVDKVLLKEDVKNLADVQKKIADTPESDPHLWGLFPGNKKDIENYKQQEADLIAKIKGYKASSDTTEPKTTTKPLTKELAANFLRAAGGDKEKARVLAKAAGYDF